MQARGKLLGMPAAQFLRRYWQKHPLLIRGAFPDFQSPITPNDLAGAACEEGALARLVQHDRKRDRWRVRSGPLEAATFAKLRKRDWTLLVQDCDKWFAAVGALLDRFDFLPAWRLDDIMVSYAVDGGSVGAHVDQYDVFLLQGMGTRRWQISVDENAPRDFRPNVELKLLREFTPTHEFVLEPGDMLYLPPGVPHHGVSIGECMTFSVGLRAPSVGELGVDLADQFPEELRYADPDLAAAKDPGEIDDATLARLSRILAKELGDPRRLREWFPRFITRYRSAVAAAPPRRTLALADLERRIARGAELYRSPFSRAAFVRGKSGATLYLAGDAFECSLALARLLTRQQSLGAAEWTALAASDREALRGILNAGHWVVANG